MAAIPASMLVVMAVIVLQSPKQEVQQLGPKDITPPPPAHRKPAPVLPRQLATSGISNPAFLEPQDVELAPSDAVIGLVVAGAPRAYLRQALAGVAKKHVVSDPTAAGKITVTHCDLAQCTRVFVELADDAPREIRVGGLQQDQTLALLIDGQRYSQLDPTIPLAEFPFEETSWAAWLAEHPNTKVYIGGQTDG